MNYLAITPMSPPTSGRDLQGANKRFGMFLDAFGESAKPVHIVRLVPEWIIDEPENDVATLNRKESDHWGREVRVTLIARRTRQENFYNHYVAGMFRAADQKNLYPFSGAAMARALSVQLEQNHDLVFVHKLAAMCAVLQTGRRPANTVFDLDDVEHRVKLRHSVQKPVWPGKLAYALHVPALFAAERKGAALSQTTIVCSELDRDHLIRLRMHKVVVVPNGVSLPAVVPELTPEKTILFIGLMTYEPNIEAATRLARDIMPLIWRSVPQARLLIAGDGSKDLRGHGDDDERIEYLGFVPDIDALYARSRIICCPLRNGGGTRIKLIEAAAYGKPIVSTFTGAEGLAFIENEEILLCNDDSGLADASIRLLNEDAACMELSKAASAKMRSLYEKSAVIRNIRDILNVPPDLDVAYPGPRKSVAATPAQSMSSTA